MKLKKDAFISIKLDRLLFKI